MHVSSAEAALLIQTLVAFGSVIGRRPFFRVEADDHHTNMFTLLVGDTSKGRKGTSLGYVRRLFASVDDEWERDRVVSGLSSGEGLIWQVRDPIETKQPVKVEGRVEDYESVIENEPWLRSAAVCLRG